MEVGRRGTEGLLDEGDDLRRRRGKNARIRGRFGPSWCPASAPKPSTSGPVFSPRARARIEDDGRCRRRTGRRRPFSAVVAWSSWRARPIRGWRGGTSHAATRQLMERARGTRERRGPLEEHLNERSASLPIRRQAGRRLPRRSCRPRAGRVEDRLQQIDWWSPVRARARLESRGGSPATVHRVARPASWRGAAAATWGEAWRLAKSQALHHAPGSSTRATSSEYAVGRRHD